MRPIPTPPSELHITQVLHAFSDPVRLSLVRQLAVTDGPIACGNFTTSVARSTLSYHFRILRESGVIESERFGGLIVNRLRTSHLTDAFPGLLEAVLPFA